jgi:AmmeMemoRadiSam system protein A
MVKKLSQKEKSILLSIAREAIILVTQNKQLPELNLSIYSIGLIENGASFVTLHRINDGQLRGCIGTLEPYQPLIKDVQHHAVAAAIEDYRFPPVSYHEVSNLTIEISRLTPSVALSYSIPMELPGLLKPGVDGVTLSDGQRKATFLPQVWDQLPDPEQFLDHLCRKMGSGQDLWRKKILDVSIYQVEEFQE